MGGGHVYTRNQCIIARQLGWAPIVIHFSKRPTFISELKQFDQNRIYEMKELPAYFTKKERERVISRFMDIIEPNEGEEYFVESNGVRYSYWGELIAERLKCKHFAFLVEAYFDSNDDYTGFFKFKLQRKELASIGDRSLQNLFGNSYKVKNYENKTIRAYCLNSVEDVDSPVDIDYSRYDVVIGNIGRSNKPYVMSLGPELSLFALRHPEKKILFLIVGGIKGSPEEEQIIKQLDDAPNVDLVSTGFLFPIPLNMLKKVDLAIASAGGIKVAQQADLITIAYKDDVNFPYGVIGYDIKALPLSPTPKNNYSLSDLLEQLLFGDYLKRFKYEQILPPLRHEESMRQLANDTEYMMSKTTCEYYDTTSVLPKFFLRKLYIKTIGRFISVNMLLKVIGRV